MGKRTRSAVRAPIGLPNGLSGLDSAGSEEPSMTATQIDLKLRLQQRLEETLAELAYLEERLEGKGDYGLGKGDPSIYEWEMCLALKQRTENQARSLEAALRRAAEGDFGICERCGEPIDPERLEIVPDTKRCIQCAQKR